MKLCHELGHCVLGAFYNLHPSLDIREKHEYRANRWAIETLVPYNELMDAAKDGRTEPWELAEHFEVPEDFIRNAIQHYQGIK